MDVEPKIDSFSLASLQSIAEEKLQCVISFSKQLLEERPKVVYVGVGIITFVVFKHTIGVPIRHKFFAWFNNLFIQHKDENYEAYKKMLFADLKDIKSKFTELQQQNALKILEIGVGSGANFNHYPEGSHLIVVDPNPYFKRYFSENSKKFPKIQCDEIIQSSGEEMSMVADESVDVVVMTLVLCSVQDVKKVCQQIKRVLVPGGKYFFMEHIKEWDDKKHWLRKFFQVILTRSGIWPFFFDGCQLNRNPIPILNCLSFSDMSYEKFYAPMPMKLFHVVSPHVRGIAVK